MLSKCKRREKKPAWKRPPIYRQQMTNFTTICQNFEEQYNIIAKSSGAVYFIIFVVNIVMSVTAILGNSFIIGALRKCSSLHSPSKALIFSLAFSDLAVGCIAQPLFIIHRSAALTRSYRLFCISGMMSNFVGSTVVSASFVTSTAIAVDRYLALRLRLRYREVVTLKRVIIVLFASWSASLIWSALWFWDQNVQNYSRAVLFCLCFAITTSSYVIIYKKIQRYRCRVAERFGNAVVGNFSGRRTFNVIRFRRSVSSMCHLLLSFGLLFAL